MAQNPRLKRFRLEHLADHNLKTSAKTLSPLQHAERHTFQIARILTENARQDKDGYSPEMETALRNLAITLNAVSMALPNADSEASHHDDSDRDGETHEVTSSVSPRTSREITTEAPIEAATIEDEETTTEPEPTEDGATN